MSNSSARTATSSVLHETTFMSGCPILAARRHNPTLPPLLTFPKERSLRAGIPGSRPLAAGPKERSLRAGIPGSRPLAVGPLIARGRPRGPPREAPSARQEDLDGSGGENRHPGDRGEDQQ